jgi:hypothetical protein
LAHPPAAPLRRLLCCKIVRLVRVRRVRVLAALEGRLKPRQRNVNDSELPLDLLDTFHAFVEHLALFYEASSVPHGRRHRLMRVLGSIAVHGHVVQRVVGELRMGKKAIRAR